MEVRISPPFTVRVLGDATASDNDAPADDRFISLLPAIMRIEDHIKIPSASIDFLERELLVTNINNVQSWLWICGRPMPPRPLHHQILLSRDIVITENVELHLVWSNKGRMFIKPIPLYLLEPDFWTTHLLGTAQDPSQQSRREDLAACARGFLFTYTALIAYESDFRMARDKGLIPLSVTWNDWKIFTSQFLQNHCYAALNPRYWYGELRLSRLNKIYRFRKGHLLRGYSKVAAHTVYVDLLADNFGVVAAVLGYVVIVLTAMQVGLATDRLQPDPLFQDVSYGLTIFSIIAPLAAAVAIIAAVLAMFISNWAATEKYQRKRFNAMGVEPDWLKKGKAKVENEVAKDLSHKSSLT
jgi:hypothetical protein